MQLKARFANDRHRLWPGQLLNVRLTLQTLQNALALPSIAVNQGPNGPFAYVIENDVAVARPLTIDLQQNEITTVRSGVEAGDSVVIEGRGLAASGRQGVDQGATHFRDRERRPARTAAHMNISAPFIRRPIATSLIATALPVLGIIAYARLPVAALPQVDAPTIQDQRRPARRKPSRRWRRTSRRRSNGSSRRSRASRR